MAASAKMFKHCMMLLAYIGLIVVAYLVIAPKLRQVEGMERQRDELRAEIDRLQRQIDELKERQRRFKDDPAFIERVARDQQLALPGEKVFVFDEDGNAQSSDQK